MVWNQRIEIPLVCYCKLILSACVIVSSNFCPHLIFKFGDLIEFSVLKD